MHFIDKTLASVCQVGQNNIYDYYHNKNQKSNFVHLLRNMKACSAEVGSKYYVMNYDCETGS